MHLTHTLLFPPFFVLMGVGSEKLLADSVIIRIVGFLALPDSEI